MKYQFRNKIIFRMILYPLSLLYGLIMLIRNFLFDHGILPSHDMGIPVISVGNLTAGGTGKTPMTIFLLDHMQKIYDRIVMVSRGYGRKSRGALVVSDGQGKVISPWQGGDEPVMIAREFSHIPVIVSEKRVTGIQMARDLFDAQLIVLDDAFQHRHVKRDINIVLIDAQKDIARESMLPAGDRREPLSSLSRCDVLIFTRTGNADRRLKEESVKKWFSGPVIFSDYIPDKFIKAGSAKPVDPGVIKGRRVFAFCAIAGPEAFLASLRQFNLTVAGHAFYDDHYSYRATDIKELVRRAIENKCEYIVTTAKDLTKLDANEFDKIELLALHMQLMLDDTKLLQIVGRLIDKE